MISTNNNQTRLAMSNSAAIIWDMEEFKDRLKKLMDLHGDNQKTLAAKIKRSQGLIGHYLSGRHEPRPTTLKKIANLYEIDPGELQYGEKKLDEAALLSTHAYKIPLIDWAQIDQILKIGLKLKNLGAIPHQIITIMVEKDTISESCFALRVMGDAMKPDKCDGDIVIIDPTQSPSSKKTVLFHSSKEKKYKLRQYTQEDGEFYLRAHNPDKEEYPKIPLTSDIKIAGVVAYTIRKD